MGKNLELKKQQVSEITKKFQAAKSVIVVSYSGLTVEQVTGLRAQFRAAGVEYVVLKNTLVRRSLEDMKIEGMDEVLNGPSAFAFGMEDAVSPAKIIKEFIDKNKSEAIKFKAGLLGAELMDVKKVEELAKMPGRNELLARLVGSMNSPISSFVRVLDAIAKKQAEGAQAPEAPAAEAPAAEEAPAEA